MSLIIHYQNGKLISSNQIYKRTTPAPVYLSDDGRTFVMGEVFGATYEEVAKSNWREDPNVLNSFNAAISVAYADENECAFASDINGIEGWYVYHKDTTFILSDDFWDIVRIIQPTLDDIDSDRTRVSLVSPSINGNTLIKNLNMVFPFTIGRYDVKENILDVKKYSIFKYTNEISDVDEAVERMDCILNQSMQHVKETCGDVKYGVGVSGGLDSRVIPHYAKQNGMKLVGFNVCVPKPHKLFTARSCKNAKKIADAFDISYVNTKWNPNTVEDKIEKKVQCYPLGGGRNSFKYESSIPEFDVLLTGASGLIVGSMLPTRINEFSRDELVAEMLSFFNKEDNHRTFASRAARGLNYVFGTKFKANSKSAITELVSSEDMQKGQQAIIDFIDNGIKAGQTNIEIYEDFFSNVIGYRNRYGAYESILGMKRSFSIYVPFLYKETLKWSPELLFDRVVLKRLITNKVPEVKDIKSELFEPAPGQRVKLWNKLINMIDFLVRGNGAAVDDYWMKKRCLKKKLSSRLDNGCTWFTSVFNTDAKKLKATLLKSNQSELMIDIWELKTLIDCLETKEYMKQDWRPE